MKTSVENAQTLIKLNGRTYFIKEELETSQKLTSESGKILVVSHSANRLTINISIKYHQECSKTMQKENPVEQKKQFTTYRYPLRLPQGYILDRVIAAACNRPNTFYFQISLTENQQSIFFLAVYSTDSIENPVLWQTPLLGIDRNPKGSYEMVGDDEFIALCWKERTISVIRPLKMERVEYPFDYDIYEPFDSSTRLFFFRATKMFCMFEIRYNEATQITYFSSETFSRDQRPVAQICTKYRPLDNWQMDQHSKIGYEAYNNLFLCFYIIQLEREGETITKKERKIIVQNNDYIKMRLRNNMSRNIDQSPLVENRSQHHIYSRILVQISPHEYLAFLHSVFHLKRIILLVVDTSQGDEQAFFKDFQTKLDNPLFYPDLKDTIWKTFTVFGKYVLIRIVRQVGDKTIHKLLYVNIETRQTQVYEEKETQKWWFGQISQTVLAEYIPDSGHFEITDWSIELRDISLHCLLHLNQDFDDDLLFDCISLLCEND